MPQSDALLAAIEDLVNEPEPRYKRDALAALEEINRVYPMRFAGALEVLNPLAAIMLNSSKEFDRIALLIESRRTAAGKELMWPPPEPEKFNRIANQRRIMRERRARSARALTYENAVRADKDKLVGKARLTFEDAVLAKWGRQLDHKLESARIQNGGPLSREATQRIREAHWAAVDAELDELEAARRREGLL